MTSSCSERPGSRGSQPAPPHSLVPAGKPLSLTAGDTRTAHVPAPGDCVLVWNLDIEPPRSTSEKPETRCPFNCVPDSPPGAEKKESCEESPRAGRGTPSIWPRPAAGPYQALRKREGARREPSVLAPGKGRPPGSNSHNDDALTTSFPRSPRSST